MLLTVSTNSHFANSVHSKSTCIHIKRTQFQQEGRRVFIWEKEHPIHSIQWIDPVQYHYMWVATTGSSPKPSPNCCSATILSLVHDIVFTIWQFDRNSHQNCESKTIHLHEMREVMCWLEALQASLVILEGVWKTCGPRTRDLCTHLHWCWNFLVQKVLLQRSGVFFACSNACYPPGETPH